jgi:hypothetical protein
MRFHGWTFIALAVLLVIAPLAKAAQGGVCPEIVKQAIADLGANCDSLDRNSACYGYNQVGATFNEPQADDYFSKASDRSGLNLIDTLTTAPLNEAERIWGVAVMKVQANVPNSLPGQAVAFVLLGDAEVRNEVPESEAFTPADPVQVSSIGNVNIRSGPSRNANVIKSVTDGTALMADARSGDNSWLRIVYEDAPGWVSAELVNLPVAIDTLPVITSQTRTPMQSFYLTTGPGTLSCNDAPDVLLVQGPENFKVDLTVNGADIQIGSTVALRSIQMPYRDLVNNDRLVGQFGSLITNQNANDDDICNVTQLMVIDGEADLNAGIIRLPTGFTADSVNCGGADLTSGFMTGWGGSRALAQEELDFLHTLGELPPELLNYPIQIPTMSEIQQYLVLFNPAGSGGIIQGPAAGKADCSAFKPTSPLGSMPANNVTFYWDPAPGATSYTVQVFDSGGAVVGEYSVNAPQTSVSGAPGGQDNMSWQVMAYVDGELACSTAPTSVLRDKFYNSASSPGFTTTCIPYFMCVSPCTSGPSCGAYDVECTCPI